MTFHPHLASSVPWLGVPLAWVLGVVFQLHSPGLWMLQSYKLFCALSLFLIGVSALILRIQWHCSSADGSPSPAARSAVWLVLCLLGVALLGFASTGWRAAAHRAQLLSPVWEGRTLRLSGVVEGLPRSTSMGWRLVFAVDGLSEVLTDPSLAAGQALPPPPPEGFPQRVLLSWAAQPDGPVPRAGERWQVAVRLREPHGLANPHGFDTERWLWEQGLGATGYVRFGTRDPAPHRLSVAGLGLHPWRERIRQQIQARVADARVAGVLAALTVGDQAAIERGDWDVFRATGVAHLVSISGLHITWWAWLTTALVARLWRWAPRVWPGGGSRLLLACPAPVAAAWGGWALALGYAVFSGWGVPAQRTVLMLSVVVGLRLLGRRWPWPVVGLVALALVLAWEPGAWWQPGFWLSFVAVGVLLAAAPAPGDLQGPPWSAPGLPVRHRLVALGRSLARPVVGMARTQWVITLALAPLTLVLFGQVSVVGLVANLVAIPAVTLVITPLALSAVVWPWLWEPVAVCMQVLLSWLESLSQWPWASLQWPAMPMSLALAAVGGGLVLAMRWPWSLRAMGIALVLPALLWRPERPAHGEFEVLAADVGQGSAVLVRTATASLLYDAGPQWGPQSDAGQRVLLPLLHALGETPRRVVLSHRDGDHVGGALSVLDRLSVSQLALPWSWAAATAPEPLRVWASFGPPDMVSAWSDPVLARRVLARLPDWTRCEAGQRWEQDGVHFEMLHPTASHHARPGMSSNNLSCVLRVRGRSASALLPGDLDAAHEAELVQAHPDLRADWLLAPHHGSQSSSSEVFLQAVRPGWLVVQAGVGNRYGHPAPAVVQRYGALGLRWAGTPACGASRWRSDQPANLYCQRQPGARYWHWQPGVEGVTHGPEPLSAVSLPALFPPD